MSGFETRSWIVQQDTPDTWSVWRVTGEAKPDCGIELDQVAVDLPLEEVGLHLWRETE